MGREYRQFCAVARALDVVGERWTLLIVRELLLGERRYGELLDALQGIGTNLLAARLTAMQNQGLCTRAGRYYALTERGHELREPVLALARWGMAEMARPAGQDHMHPDWYAVAMLAAYEPSDGVPPDEEYEFDIDGVVFHLALTGGRPDARRGSAGRAAFALRAELPTFLRIATGSLPTDRAEIHGDSAAVSRWLASFHLLRDSL